MAIKYKFNKSKTLDFSKESSQSQDFIRCNSLVEKIRYIYYRQGPEGVDDPCGKKKYKMKKSGLTWRPDGLCEGGKVKGYRISRRS